MSLSVVCSFYRDAHTMGAPIALRGVRVLYGDDGGRRNSALGRRIALMATTTTNGGAF